MILLSKYGIPIIKVPTLQLTENTVCTIMIYTTIHSCGFKYRLYIQLQSYHINQIIISIIKYTYVYLIMYISIPKRIELI